jgi:gliding motility-associated-like protein
LDRFIIKVTISFMLLTVNSYRLFSQAKCNGVWGTPLVNITFGAGPNPGPALKAATLIYNYTSSDCPPDGAYAIRNKTQTCFYNDWHSVTNDHTGDPDGYFLLVNSSFQSDNFYLDTIRNLCSSTTYEFSAWILNMATPASCDSNSVKPNINFRVEKTNGDILESFNTNDIPSTASPEWKRYAFVFSTLETSIVLRMSNINPGGCGGDFALDDIMFRPCVADVNINLSTQNSPPKNLVYQCNDRDTSFTFNSNFNNIYTNVGYQWQSSTDSGRNWTNIAGANQSSYTRTFPSTNNEGLQIYRLNIGELDNIAVPKCLVQANIDTVSIVSPPRPSSSSNTPVCEGDRLTMTSSGGNDYHWTGVGGFFATGNSVSIEKTRQNSAGVYVVDVTSAFGCSTLDSISVVINPAPKALAGADTSICEGNAVRLIGAGGIKYAWSPAIGLSNTTVPDPEARPLMTTVYTLKVIDTLNCADSASITITVLKPPVANAGPDKRTGEAIPVQLDGAVTGAASSYYWTPDLSINNTKLLQPSVSPLASTVYTLHAISEAGCGVSADDVLVTVITRLDIPNAFSPNNDGINDTWAIKDLAAYSSAEIRIYNRYGQQVFVSRGYNKPWDGRYNGNPLPVGTYYYIIDLKNQNNILQGSVTLLK